MKRPDTMTMADIIDSLEKQGVDVREDYWSSKHADREVFITMSPVDLAIKEVKVDEDGNIHVIQGELPEDYEHVEFLG